MHVINALRRWKEAINPIYTYGKRQVEEEPVMHASEKILVPKRRSKSAFSSFMFPDHGARMSFAARGHKAHMVFAPLESPYSDKVVAA